MKLTFLAFSMLLAAPHIDATPTTPHFVQQCRAPATDAIAYTINVIRNRIQESDCDKMWANLKERDFLHLPGYGISDLSPIQEMTELSQLRISDNKLKDLKFIKNMPKLTFFVADGNDIEDLSPLVKGAPNLSFVSIMSNRVLDISPLNEIKSIEHIRASDNKIRNLNLANLQELKTLGLADNQVQDISHLRHNENLISVNFNRNAISDLSPLTDLNELWSLDLDDNNITSLEPLRGLQRLNLLQASGNAITDITPISQLPSLSHVWLNRNQITTLPAFASPKLGWLELGHNAITEASALADFVTAELAVLLLNDNQIGSLPTGTYLQASTKLSIANNKISSLEFLKGTGERWYLDASGNQIKDVAPLAEETELRVLRLDRNNIETLDPLRELEGITDFYLDANPLGTTIGKTPENCPVDGQAPALEEWCIL